MDHQSQFIKGIHIVSYNSSPQNNNSILFIHGAWHSSFYWEKYFLPYFAEKGFSCYALDLRSHGKSHKKGKFRLISLNNYVEDVLTVVQEISKDTKDIILVAHSMGGLIAQKFLVKHPNIVKSAVLLAPAMSWGVKAITFRIMLHHPLMYLKMNLMLSLSPMVNNFKIYKETFYYSVTDDKLLQEFQSQTQDESYRAYINMILSRIKHKSILIPILIIGGKNDTIFSEKQLVKLAFKIPNANSVFFDNTGHNMMLEQDWMLIADKIITWIKE